MKYAHILMAVASEIWAIDANKLDQIVSFLALQVEGEKLSSEELQARITKQAQRDVARREGAVALLPLRGVIANRMNMMSDISGGTSSEGFGRMFDAAVADPDVKAIVIDVDSPGGAVSGTDELSAKIFAARGRKPIVAHVNPTAASAAYWIATAADEMVLNPSAEVGSIGVLGVHDDISAALEKAGVKRTLMSAGEFKGEMAPFLPLSEEARAYAQTRIDAYYDQFVRAVARNRNVSLAAVRENFGKGRMVMSKDAIAVGMADSIGTIDEVLQRFGSSQPAREAKRAADDIIEMEAQATDENAADAAAEPAPRRTFAREREKRALEL